MNWTISRDTSRDGKGWHVQARSEDQMNSFATVVHGGATFLRTETPNGKEDVFTLTQQEPHVTFNIVGKIRYVQNWEGIA